jgi:hypothetical protein
MIHEQISFNGRPAIGFGDAVSEKKQLEAVFVPPLVGFLVGSIGGAVLGSLVEKGVGTAVGTIAGGVGGAAVGLVVGYHLAHPDSAVATSTPATPTPWRRIPVEDIAIADAPADAAGLKNINTESFAADGLAAEVWVRDTPK